MEAKTFKNVTVEMIPEIFITGIIIYGIGIVFTKLTTALEWSVAMIEPRTFLACWAVTMIYGFVRIRHRK